MLFVDLGLVTSVASSLVQHIRYADACRSSDNATQATTSSLSPASAVVVPAPTPAIATQKSSRSMFGLFSSAPAATNSAPGSQSAASLSASGSNQPYTLSQTSLSKWSIFVPVGETLVATALVNKPNPVGKANMRQIILLSSGLLLYIDAEDFSVKGTIVTRNESNPLPRTVRIKCIYVVVFCVCLGIQ